MFGKLTRFITKLGTSFVNSSDRRRLRSVLGVMPLEDRTVPSAIPITGPNGGAWVKVDTLTVSTRTNQNVPTGVTSNVVLDAGTIYLAVASGTARIATDATGFTDAEYIRYNKSTGPQDGSSPGYAWNNHGVRIAGVSGGGTGGNFWGGYQADHVYPVLVAGQGAKVTGYYSDIPGYYGDNSGTLTVDLYAEVPTVAVDGVLDAAESGSTGLFRFTRTGSTDQPLVVSVLVEGTATPGVDYQTLPQTITFPAGVDSVEVPVIAVDDSLVEGLETVMLTVVPNEGFVVDDHSVAEVRISDDDGDEGVISGTVFKDNDGNGIRDGGDLGFQADTVDLRDESGTVIRTTVTDSDGHYRFDGLPVGTYSVRFGQPSLTRFTLRGQGVDLNNSSQADVNGYTGPISLTSGSLESRFINAGLVQQAAPPRPDDPKSILVHISYSDGSILAPNAPLKVAKWSEAFEAAAGPRNRTPQVRGPDGDKQDFIDRDPDRFYIRIFDAKNWGARVNNIQAQISTDNLVGYKQYNDNPTNVSLVRMTADGWEGWYTSDSQMLVSNTVDDIYQTATLQADEQGPSTVHINPSGAYVSDRTHILALGGTIKVGYAGQVQTATAAVAKTLKLHVTILQKPNDPNGAPNISLDDVNANIAEMREEYAQAGIQIVLVGNDGKVVDAVGKSQIQPEPPGVKLNNGLDEYPGFDVSTGKIAMTAEEQALLGFAAYRTPPDANGNDDIEVYYVNYLSSGSNGEAFAASLVPDAKYANSIVLDGHRIYHLIGHESLHVLLNAKGHEGGEKTPSATSRTNLLVVGDQSFRTGNSVIDSRRISDAQVAAILAAGTTLLQ
ncbi:na-ca exchanger integrin-beta4 : Regulatory P domain of subtilisin-like proprotein convertases OS=Oscillatoria acuminata PCC 6304 GN=Oscil6304_2815 PE=3 SV=1: Calx-beta: CarboxypepD_reg [Gemmataceae bacterium]|nr:na-ca exchanger integrin-beta4 : Regulatory P domain of subtilisin-like proprotein convertases OS=Oscillatoria acuminata PCC 6304 GN=Oscil6304_2815 PE=3 SV=1: Calx-beta: CarboxypepD_reg [Gemmataceae bacterium]VTU01014.1 na-ca exchanger integrin-beta4 : Regulatory P domain of subtilisin-like proprotein convertases OS=Oscillatoria acuminata PCC 6304 GN=Oscil6304_2815 PE=3 SV=1: Calx-beta: CarboxypepD_reg [Gemmataceae bacterium]